MPRTATLRGHSRRFISATGLLVGGWLLFGATVAPAQIVNVTGSLVELGQRNLQAAEGMPVVPFHGRLYVGGGSTGRGGTTRFWSYNPATNAWLDLGDARYELISSLRLLDGYLYAPMADPSDAVEVLLRVSPAHQVSFINAGGTSTGHDVDIYRHDNLIFTSGSLVGGGRMAPGVGWYNAGTNTWTYPQGTPPVQGKVFSFVPLQNTFFTVSLYTVANQPTEYPLHRYNPAVANRFTRLGYTPSIANALPPGSPLPVVPTSRGGAFTRPDGAWVQVDQSISGRTSPARGVAVISALDPALVAQRVTLSNAPYANSQLFRDGATAWLAIEEYTNFDADAGTVRLFRSAASNCLTWTEVARLDLTLPLADASFAVVGTKAYFAYGGYRSTYRNGPKSGTLFSVTLPNAPLATQPAAAGLALYPTPAHDVLTITGAAPGTPVSVSDVLGRTVLTAAVDASNAVDVSALAPGVYVLALGQGTQRRVGKFVKAGL